MEERRGQGRAEEQELLAENKYFPRHLFFSNPLLPIFLARLSSLLRKTSLHSNIFLTFLNQKVHLNLKDGVVMTLVIPGSMRVPQPAQR